MERIPTIEETTLGVFLHDIGKFMQRAHGSVSKMDADARELENVVLPPNGRGGYTHKHALWTAAFFRMLEKSNELGLPAGLNHDAVYDVAVYHHKPSAIEHRLGGFAWLSAEADRLSAGMDRKKNDEETEERDDRGAWDQFMKTPLRNPFAGIELQPSLGKANPSGSFIPLGPLEPGEAIMPVAAAQFDKQEMPAKYETLWKMFVREFARLQGLKTAAFLEALYSLSERMCYAIPSSTVDQPDINLHDHHRAAAAVAGAMYQWHEADGSLTEAAKIRDKGLAKFRFLVGDLSGIQSTLFQLPSQQVKGVNKILRARSFLFGTLLEATALELREAMGLPVFSVLQCAGGRLLMLVGNTASNEAAFLKTRESIEKWMFHRYRGTLALNLSLTAPIRGDQLNHEKYSEVVDALRKAGESAKLRPFSTCLQTVHRDLIYRDQTCGACGTKPWTVDLGEDGQAALRCDSCADDFRIGGALPKATALSWRRNGGTDSLASVKLFCGWQLHLHDNTDTAGFGADSAFAIWGPDRKLDTPLPRRYLANYVPRVSKDDLTSGRYRHTSDEAQEQNVGELKLFEQIAADALERDANGHWKGVDHLAVLKADVDRLGQIFSGKSGASSLSRYAALSRMMDFFFTGYLHQRLASVPEFQSTYTVYAGGDDLLLIGPWRQMISLAADIQARFTAWTGHNPNITISAGIELMKPAHPIQRVAHAAEERLERAKGRDRNKICVIQKNPLDWGEMKQLLARGERLAHYLATGQLHGSFVYRMLYFDELRQRCEAMYQPNQAGEAQGAWIDLEAAGWRSQWAYALARNVRDRLGTKRAAEAAELTAFLNELLGLGADFRRQSIGSGAVVPLTLAMYRQRG